MRKLTLTASADIIEELSMLCADRPKSCKKEGAMGWVSNDRIVVIKNGYFQYYNRHPGFVENDPLSIKQKYFKAAVRLDYIHQVNYLPKSKIRKNILELIFPKNRILLRIPTDLVQEQEEANERRLDEEDLEKWVFEFVFDIKDVVDLKREEYKEEKRHMSRIEDEDKGTSDPTYTLIPDLSQQVQEDALERNIEDYVKVLQNTKDYLRSKAEMAEEEAARQRRKKEKEMLSRANNRNQNIEQAFSISPFWRQYFKLFENLMIQKEGKPIETVLKNELNMLKMIEYFNSSAVQIVEDYVDERAIGWDGAKQKMEGFRFYQGLWIKIGGKELNQQFLVNYYLNDIFYSMREFKKIKLRLPLMSLIKYKGLKVLVMCDMPFSELDKTEVYNLHDESIDLQLMTKFRQILEVIEDILNVKSQLIEFHSKKKISAPLGVNLKIYQYNFNKDKAQDQAVLPNFYYLINPGIVFPLDFNAQREQIQPLARLRPELVAAFRDYNRGVNPQLFSQAFMESTMPEEFKRAEEEKVLKACRWLKGSKVKQLIDKLNNLDLIIIDSYSLKTMMGEMGINIRYLHIISQYSLLPYIREHLLADALARVIKKEFRSALKELEREELGKQEEFLRMKNSERIQVIKERKADGQQIYKELAIDYLNLVFGSGHQTEEFWKIVVSKCIEYYHLEASYPPKVKPGVLLHAVLWHCNLKVGFDKSVALFEGSRPFSDPSSVKYKVSVKTFDYPSFQIQKLFRGVPSPEDHISEKIFEESTSKLLKLELLFYNTLNFNFQSAVAISKMSNYDEYLKKVEMQNPMHPAVIPYYMANKSQQNFHKALEVMQFALPESHPLLVTLHLEYSNLFQRPLMKKTGLMLAVKNIGQFHPKTTEIYSKLYHEGWYEYTHKVKRARDLESVRILCSQMFADEKFDTCLNYVLEQIQDINQESSSTKLGTGNYQAYLDILMQGLESAVKVIDLPRGLQISEELSIVISSFKFDDNQLNYRLFKHVLSIHMLMAKKKYFLYKLVLLSVHIRQQHEVTQVDGEGCVLPVSEKNRTRLLEGLSMLYTEYKTHSKWIGFILQILVRSFQYFNYLQDLFNDYSKHIRKYNSEAFRECLGFWDIFIRVYGQSFFKEILYDVKFN